MENQNENPNNSNHLIEEKSPFNYFKELVEKALDHQKVISNDYINFYLVNLLTEFSSVHNINNRAPAEDDQSLLVLINKALTESNEDRIKKFKYIGDYSLFISGFFSDSLKRKIVDINYYICAGVISYHNLAQLMRTKKDGEVFSNIFEELAGKFPYFVDILAEVSDSTAITSNQDLLRIYENWFLTKGKRQEALLKKQGLIPIIPTNHLLQ